MVIDCYLPPFTEEDREEKRRRAQENLERKEKMFERGELENVWHFNEPQSKEDALKNKRILHAWYDHFKAEGCDSICEIIKDGALKGWDADEEFYLGIVMSGIDHKIADARDMNDKTAEEFYSEVQLYMYSHMR